MELNRAFGQALKALRVRKGVSQEDTGASQSYVSDVERGLKSISIDKLDEFATNIGVHPISILFKSYLIADGNQTIESLVAQVIKDLEVEIQSQQT